MSTTLKAKFDTRREAEMTVERLVQEQKIDRAKILITTDGGANSVGSETAGADADAPDSRENAALADKIVVSVEIADDASAAKIKAAFAEFDASNVAQS